MDWWTIVESVQSHMVQITTPRGSGSGFLLHYSIPPDMCAIATAAHVVNDSHWWEEPIRIFHPETGQTRILRHDSRYILFEHKYDTAVLLFKLEEFPLPKTPVAMIEEGKVLKVGNEVGWLGFPAVSIANLCFFSGRVSAWLPSDQSYLVDGVAINGVSGGPTYVIYGEEPRLVGVVSAYIPNYATGVALPGLSVVRHVRQFYEVIKRIKNVDEAAEQQKQTPPQPPREGAVPTSK